MHSTTQRVRLLCELLEARAVPSVTSPDVDLSTHGTIGSIEGAIFRQFDAQPTGTGVIDAFVRLQAKGAGAQVQQGYNTDFRKLQFDENSSPQFTRSLRLSDIPEVNLGGTLYREFLLDINQKASQPYLSLDALRIYLGSAGNLTGLDLSSGQLAGLLPIYDLDSSGDHWVKLNSRLNQGSGKGDMLLYVPSSLFAGADPNVFVYLYSRFGDNATANAGFEEWAVSRSTFTDARASISGTITDTSGAGLSDVVVFLDANGNGILDNNEVYTVTDANGNYAFNDLVGGLGDLSKYYVSVIPPPNSTQVSPDNNLVSLTSVDSHGILDFVFSVGPPNS